MRGKGKKSYFVKSNFVQKHLLLSWFWAVEFLWVTAVHSALLLNARFVLGDWGIPL